MSTHFRFSSLLTNGCFVAACAVALSWETSLIARTPLPSGWFYAFVFFATWSAYRIHALARAFAVDRSLTAALVGATLVSATHLPRGVWPAIAVAAAMSIGYSVPFTPRGRRLRDFGLAKIGVLAGVWTLVTAYLPLHGTGLTPHEMTFFLVRRFTFMFALCLAFDVRDCAEDAAAGIRTLPVRVGIARSYALVRATLVLFALLLLVTPLAMARDPAHRPATPVTLALFASAILTWAAIEFSRARGFSRDAGRLYYLGAIDGMMALQSVLVGIAWWLGTA